MIKIYRVKCEKWRKRPSGYSYYFYEPSEGLIHISENELLDDSIITQKIKFIDLRLKP
tara:strand:+ start:237 stop:410 length:174 start_codon:yes stop_codon:yes gene_type:complete